MGTSEIGEPRREILVKMSVDTPLVDPPPIEIALDQVEVIVKKESVSPKKVGPSKMIPTDELVDTLSSNPPPDEPVARRIEVVVKQEVIKGGEPR